MRCAALAFALALAVAGLARRAGAELRVDLDAPAPAVSESPLGLVEVRGRGGAGGARGHDVAIAIDVSDSTTAPSGVDLDGDGPQGRTSAALLQSLRAAGADETDLRRLEHLDLDDSILFAELAAAETLLGRLDPSGFRVALIAFSDRARVLAPLGSHPEALRRALATLRVEFWRDLRGTNFEAAIRAAVAELAPASDPARGTLAAPKAQPRERSLLLLSDGVPTLPPHGNRPSQFAIEAAQDAALAGVRIYTYALGPEAEGGLELYRAIAATTGGRFEHLARPADAIARLRRVDLANLASVEIVNETSGEPGRAVRTFPDGSFDGFVRLVPGSNRLRITAVAGNGSRATVRREVRFTPAADGAVPPALATRQRELLEELRRRTAEVELWAEVERGRSIQLREIELEAERAREDVPASP
ncbi:MAG TPA: vWA domain-containing protein [Myxococcota bacterium]|nr:vWA domain-containing protein [Myxococcota bacterium]